MSVRRVVVLGAESTGSTTLAQDLADHLGTLWVPELLREHAEVLAERDGSIWDVAWTSVDFDDVADGQDAAERAARGAGPPSLRCPP